MHVDSSQATQILSPARHPFALQKHMQSLDRRDSYDADARTKDGDEEYIAQEKDIK